MATTHTVTVRYFAAARAAAGADSEAIAVPAGASVADVLNQAASRHGQRLSEVLARCSFLVDSLAVHDRTMVLHDGAELDILPPFAGG